MFPRNKLVSKCLLILGCVIMAIQMWRVTTRSKLFKSSSGLMASIHHVEKRVAESLLSDNLRRLLPIRKNTFKPLINRKRKHRKKRRQQDEIFDETYRKSHGCMRDIQRGLARYLNHQYKRELAPDFRGYRPKESRILEPECQTNLDLVIILTTRPGNFMERTAIRYSWGRSETGVNRFLLKSKKFRFKTIFTLGQDNNHIINSIVARENSRYKDILRLDYQDTYENLSKKTILTLKWVSEACTPRFVLKTDDDCYINLHNLAPWLQRLSPYIHYVGKKNDLMPVIRDPSHRNYVPYELFGEEYYKVYCSGGGYILRGSVLGNITEKAKEIPEIINEDAYLGMIASALDIIPFDDERFLPFIFGDLSLRKRHMCDWTDKFLMHGASPPRQLLMHWQKLAMVKYAALCDL